MKTSLGLVLAALAVLTAACDFNLKSTRRFRLPQGNADNGKAAFVALNCTTCHTVSGVDLPKPTVEPTAVVGLGGVIVLVWPGPIAWLWVAGAMAGTSAMLARAQWAYYKKHL